MTFQTINFSCGHSIPTNFNQENIEINGQINNLYNLDNTSYNAEITDLQNGLEIYYYYEDETFKYISDGTPPKARFQNLCEACLIGTLKTSQPHYGDGVYFTQHSELFNPKTHVETINSHGIPFRKNRATYVCIDESTFKKIKKTGGVIRSKIHDIEVINNMPMVSISSNSIFPLCIGW